MQNRIEFLQKKIEMYQDLLNRCQRPDRVTLIIEAYKTELQKIQDNGGIRI